MYHKQDNYFLVRAIFRFSLTFSYFKLFYKIYQLMPLALLDVRMYKLHIL